MEYLKYLKWCVHLAIALGILAYLFTGIRVDDVFSTMTHVQMKYFLPAVALSILVQLIAAKRLWFLVHKQAMMFSTFRLLEINLSTIFYGLFLPGGAMTSWAIRFFKLAGPDKKAEEALVSIFFDRVLATITLAIMGVLFWIIDWPIDSVSAKIVSGMGLMLGGLVALVAVVNYGIGLTSSKRFKPIVPSLIQRRLLEFRLALTRYQGASPRFLIMVFGLSMMANVFGTLTYYLLARAIDMPISFITLGWIRSAVLLICLFPVSISGFGVREGTLLFFLTSFGIAGRSVLAFSFLIYMTTMLLMGTIGGVFEAWNFLWIPVKRQEGRG